MIYNHKREAVWEWEGEPSLCPDCNGQLIARRGDIVVWHWAHKPSEGHSSTCHHEESLWHLTMKDAYRTFDGWDIEVPVEAGGKKYRADAMNISTGRIREFVHSLSEYYWAKHCNLKAAGFDVLWILDGGEFVSARARVCRGDGIRRLLKPTAYSFAEDVGALVHYAGALWSEWKHNVWFKREGPAAVEVIERFKRARMQPMDAIR